MRQARNSNAWIVAGKKRYKWDRIKNLEKLICWFGGSGKFISLIFRCLILLRIASLFFFCFFFLLCQRGQLLKNIWIYIIAIVLWGCFHRARGDNCPPSPPIASALDGSNSDSTTSWERGKIKRRGKSQEHKWNFFNKKNNDLHASLANSSTWLLSSRVILKLKNATLFFH